VCVYVYVCVCVRDMYIQQRKHVPKHTHTHTDLYGGVGILLSLKVACSMWYSWAFNPLAPPPFPPPPPTTPCATFSAPGDGTASVASDAAHYGVCPCHDPQGLPSHEHALLALLPFPVFSPHPESCVKCVVHLCMPLAPDNARGYAAKCKACSVALCPLLGILSPSRVCARRSSGSPQMALAKAIYTIVGVLEITIDLPIGFPINNIISLVGVTPS